jgi:hypothetical protein
MKAHCPHKETCYHLDFSKHISTDKSTPLLYMREKGPVDTLGEAKVYWENIKMQRYGSPFVEGFYEARAEISDLRP